MMRKILGPPGTGKTTRLLHYARTFLKLGTPIDKIGYFAFTKKAASEARERMLDQNPDISEKQLQHFRTLHSLAFWKKQPALLILIVSILILLMLLG
jgi:superfamily I DNA/RNA helicase